MRKMQHVMATVAVLAVGAAGAWAQVPAPFVGESTVSRLKAQHVWKTAGSGGDGKVDFVPSCLIAPGESSAQVDGSVRVSEGEATEEFFLLVVHAGKGSRDRGTRYRAKVSRKDGPFLASFAATLSDLVYALDLSLPQSTGNGFAKPIGAMDGPVDITSSKGQLDLRQRSESRIDVKLKASYKGSIIFGPNAGKKVKGKVVLIAKEALVE